VQDIDGFACGFLLCFGIAGRISCGIGRHFWLVIIVSLERQVRRCCFVAFVRPRCLLLLLYGAKDVCFLEMWEAPYFGDRFVAVER
jgi:hypothetical protein